MANQIPGFLLSIVDEGTPNISTADITKVHTIFGILPDTFLTEDETGEMVHKYIEPNKPILISVKSEAADTLGNSLEEVTDAGVIGATTEMINTIRMLPNDSTIALVKISNPDGSVPKTKVELYEAFNTAFEENTNFPSSSIHMMGVSMNDTAIDGKDFVVRACKHAHEVTMYGSPCKVFVGFDGPASSSNKDIENYVNSVATVAEAKRALLSTTVNGSKVDLGMYLSAVAGFNKYDGVTGLSGAAHQRVLTIDSTDAEAPKVTTQKLTAGYKIGDAVEVYTHKGLDILVVKGTVTAVEQVGGTNTDITLTVEGTLPTEITAPTGNIPVYIANTTNKDYKGTYISTLYANKDEEAGVRRSPAGLAFPGTAEHTFTSKQVEKMKAVKVVVVNKQLGKTYAEAENSSLLTGPESRFQEIESLNTIFDLVNNCKSVTDKYANERVDELTDGPLIKNEIEEIAFTPAIGVYIKEDYDLKLYFKEIRQADGSSAQALFVDFGVNEIRTLKYIRMTARLY